MSALRAYGPSGEPLWIPADDGARAHGYHRPHDARPVTVIGDMAPRMVAQVTTAARRAQMAAAREARKPHDPTRCGALMPVRKEPCARKLDHAGCHRSEYDQANAAERKRTGGETCRKLGR